MSRLGCKTQLLDRVRRQGMIGAIGAVSTASVQSSASRWRAGRGCPSPAMVKRIAAAVPLAEQLLQQREAVVANLEARRAVLRARLRKIGHGACKATPVSLGQIATLAGIGRQLLTNFRASDVTLSEAKVESLERAMKALGLMPAAE